MKTIFTITSVILFFNLTYAQQDPLYAQYMVNPLLLNPAYSGFTDNLNAMISYRNQWSSWEGGPRTFNASAHLSLVQSKMGAGMLIISDKIGSLTTTEWIGTYSYRVAVNQNSRISFGLQAGATNYKSDNNLVNVRDANDPLFEGVQSEFLPTLGAGVIWHSEKHFVGVSIPRMLNSSVSVNGFSNTLYSRHLYMQASYAFFLSDLFSLKPSTLLRYVKNSPISADVNATLVYKQHYQAGLLTRNLNTLGFLFQALVKDKIRFGYVFEVPIQNSFGTQFTTHEVSIGIRMAVLQFHSGISTSTF